jgi:MFS family permease
VVVYSVAGLALGAAADRVSRPRLIAAGLAAWSLATALSGAAQHFGHLVLARMFVGIGEATLTPAALAMLGEVLPPGWRARASGIYYAGVSIGAGLSLVVSGLIAPHYGWRLCFFVLGAVGLAVAVPLLAVPDPRAVRDGSRATRTSGAAVPGRPVLSTSEAVRELWTALRTTPALGLTLAGGVLVTFAAASAIHSVTWLVQERGYAFRQAAFTAGAIYAVAGLCGNVFGGWFADWCERRWTGGRLWSMVVTALVLLPFNVLFLTLPPNGPVFALSWALTVVSATAWYGPLFATAQELVPPRIRSTSIAFLMLVINVLGVGLGPWVTGLVGDAASLTRGLLVSVVVGASSIGPFALAARRYAADRDRVAPANAA